MVLCRQSKNEVYWVGFLCEPHVYVASYGASCLLLLINIFCLISLIQKSGGADSDLEAVSSSCTSFSEPREYVNHHNLKGTENGPLSIVKLWSEPLFRSSVHLNCDWTQKQPDFCYTRSAFGLNMQTTHIDFHLSTSYFNKGSLSLWHICSK